MAIDLNKSNVSESLPAELSSEVWAKAVKDSAVLQLAQRMTLPGNGVEVPIITGEPTATWTNETGKIETISLNEMPQYLEAGILLMAYMGLRRSEALARRWSDIQLFDKPQDGAGGVIKIDSSLRELKGGSVIFEPPKTKKSERINYIPEACASQLKKIKKRQRGEWVCEHNGLMMRPDYFSCTWRKTLKEHGLKHIQLKNLRHSCGTILIRELGASVADVAELLGHSTTATTETFYLQQSDTSKKRVAKMWQNL